MCSSGGLDGCSHNMWSVWQKKGGVNGVYNTSVEEPLECVVFHSVNKFFYYEGELTGMVGRGDATLHM